MTKKEAIEYSINLAKSVKENDIRPNPFVGAILLDSNNEIIGKGYHQKFGGPHAEVFAINEALAKIKDLSETTLYVSLEPCSHYGKTPPCCDLIIEHKIKKVVIASLDPNPKVESVEQLKKAGIEVEVLNETSAITLNRRFFTQHVLNRPYFILKSASTIDGKIADRNNKSKWISNSDSRQFVHSALRSNADAILTTYKTIIEDKASLTIRIDGTPIKETNVIIIDKDLHLLKEINKALPIFYKRSNTKIYFITAKASNPIIDKNIEFIEGEFNSDGLVFKSVANELLNRGFYTILTEAGKKLNSSLIDQRSADELYLFIAPKILNDQEGVALLGNDKANNINDTFNLELEHIQRFEDDVLLHYKFKQDFC
jgi:diaminohydroxyphosphoribosylaminopyrimidine deaminase/5-amino-6-(5-phosphoribosylamino)uracil reductase